MQEVPWEGLIVVTYGAIFGAGLTGVVALFRRMGRVEHDTARLAESASRMDEALSEMRQEIKEQGKALTNAMTDFKVHMAEEGRNVQRLEALIVTALERKGAFEGA